ncbi:MAG: AEC family transporter [Desulfurobacteriaceae bacterium]
MEQLLINVVLPLYLLIGTGYLFGKLKTELETNTISFIVLYLFAPSLIFSSFRKVEITPENFIHISLTALFVFVFSYLLSVLTEKAVLKVKEPAFEISATVMNAGYLGIPLIYLMFGEGALPYAISFMVVMAVYHFTFGILILKGNEIKEGLVAIFKIPLIYAVLLAFLLREVELPPGIEKVLKLTGDSTMPLMLVSIGISLSRVSVDQVKEAFLASAVRFIGGTLGALIAVLLFKSPPLLEKVLIVQSSLPSAVLNYVLCEEFKTNPKLAASIIFISTLLFLLYFPLLAYVISFL